MASKLIDISPVISDRLAVWPSDTPPSREVLLEMSRGDNLTLSTLRTTVHVGAHADAPSHYGVDGRTIDAQELDRYIGGCQVIRVPEKQGRMITPDDLDHHDITSTRVLFATETFPDPETFNGDFAALTPELVQFLAEADVRLVGIDTPSVDQFTSKDLPVHGAFLEHDIAIIEGLRLDGVEEGLYELIALPLKLEGFDASPVRAVLRQHAPPLRLVDRRDNL